MVPDDPNSALHPLKLFNLSRASASHLHLHLHLNAIANAPCFVSADADALDLHEARSAQELPQLSKIYGHDAGIIQRGR